MDTKRKANLGQCFIAVDPECFASGFETRLSDLMSHLRHMEPVSEEILSISSGIFI
jgi:LDH2 family malate/lactate/ureidoglycolate dehydrogenase